MNTRTVVALGVSLPLGIVVAWAALPYVAIILPILGGFALVGGLMAVHLGYAFIRQKRLTQMETGQPIDVADVRRHGAEWHHRAQEIQMRTVLASHQVGGPVIIEQLPVVAEAAPAPALLTDSGPRDLAGARAAGLSHAAQWYVGQADSGAATIRLDNNGFVAIGGDSGTGKSNTAAWLAAQVAAAGGYVFVCDPHYGNPDSISAATLPFSGAVERYATSPAEINATIALVWRIYKQRSTHPDPTAKPVMLVVDEFLEQVISQQITADSWASLLILGAGGRKQHMHGALLSVSWGAQALGQKAQPLRQMATTAIVHACAPEAAKFLAPGQALPALSLGQALYVPKLGQATLVRVPLLSRADQAVAAAGTTRPARPYAPWLRETPATPSSAPTVLPPAPVAPPTNQQRIIALLSDGTPRTNREIADALGVGVDVVTTETADLYKHGHLGRQRCTRGRERWEYLTQPTN